MLKIVHLTSAHPRFDTRIFVKQCISLSKKYETYLIVADGKGNEVKDRVNILDVGIFHGRKNRILNAPKAVYQKALDLNADLYHLHDPELIPIGVRLKNLGKKVIFDAHEDLPNQIQSKHYLNPITKKILSFLVKKYEKYSCSKLSGIVAATPFIRDKFLRINQKTVDINNYPKLEEFSQLSTSIVNKNKQVCYIGGLADVRGIQQMVDAMALTKENSTLLLAGNFVDKNLEDVVKNSKGWCKTNFLGYVGREDIKSSLESSMAGLVLLHPTQSYLDSLPVKMFEYMCAGIPVIASDFPLWQKIVLEAECGYCIDPLDIDLIAKTIDQCITHPEKCQEMGERGRKAVLERYNWTHEENKLFDFYESLLSDL